MRKFRFLSLIAVLLLAALLGGCTQEEPTVTINGVAYTLDITTLDLSGGPVDNLDQLDLFPNLTQLDLRNTGITASQYRNLQASMPNCQILWTPIFQGQAYDQASTSLSAQTLTDEDIAALANFPALAELDLTACRDYAMITALMDTYPELDVRYTVAFGGAELAPDAAEAAFTDISAEDLTTALEMLPQLQAVTLNGQLPEAADLTALTEAYPQVLFSWQVELFGQVLDNTVTEVDISEVPLETVDEVEAKVAYLPQVEKVLMLDCGISNEEMEALNQRHDDVLFVWNVDLGPVTVRSDLTTFIVYRYSIKLNDTFSVNLRYLTEMVALDLGHQDITNIDFVAYMPNLRYLIIADTRVHDLTPLTGLENLVFLEAFMLDIDSYDPLLTLTGLEDLNLGYTKGDVHVLEQMTWLKRLWWSGSGLNAEGEAALQAALPNTEIQIHSVGSSTGMGWREGQHYYDMRDLLGMPYMQG